MSWLQDLGKFTKQVITLEIRVNSNAKEIQLLRQDLKDLTQFTQKVAFAVKRYRADMDHAQERLDDKHSLLVKTLENELHRFAASNNSTAIATELNDRQKRLPEDNAGQQS
ncbi:MAG: hypothetical protein ACFB2W_07065 [Leptolyngbyaceae cyanobacterium]